MTGTIVKLRLGNQYDGKDLQDKPITTIRIDGIRGGDSEFDVPGQIGNLGGKVKITAELIQ